MANGLPSASVSGITRTADGLLWIATLKGLVSFDGARFEPFTQALPPGEITYLTSGVDSRIYVGTYGAGFATIWRGRVHVFTRPNKLHGVRISMILPVGFDEAWVGTYSGDLYHYKANALTEVGSGALPGAVIYSLAKTPDGVVWIGTGAGLFQLRDGHLSPYGPRRPIPFSSISDLAVTRSGSVFAATEGGLLKIDGAEWRSWTAKDGLPSSLVKVLASAGNDLWIGTSTGLAKLSGNAIERVGDATCPVFSLLPEVDGGVWFGCEDNGGLHRIKYPLVQALQMPKALVGAQIYSILQDRSGAVWIAGNRGLAKWYNNKATLYTTNDGLESNEILGISFAPDNSVWIATENGFANLRDGHLQNFRTLRKGFPDQIYSILEDESGTVWIGANRGLLHRRSGETQFEIVPQVRSTVWSIREDSKGNIWAATDDSGLFRLSSDSVVHYGRESGLMTNTAIDTLELPNGDIWVTTKRGLVRIRNGRCAHLDTLNGLPEGSALTILDDGQDHFWIRFGEGVFILKISEANSVLDNGSGKISGRFIGGEDGFGDELSSAVDANSILQHSSGEIWFALVNGVARVDPLVLGHETPELVPEVFHVTTDAGERDLTQQIVANAANKNVRFAFSAPTLTGAKNLEYRYRLIGFDEQWQKIETASPVMYTSLPPGKYRFEVSARHPYGSWSSASKPVDLQVLPHFYQTWWWYLLTANLLLLIILVSYRLRLATVRKRFADLMTERLNERSRLARELHDTVSQNLVAILIQLEAAQVLLKRDPPAIGKYLDNVSQLASEATKETRMSIFALRSPELHELSLRQMLQQSAASFSADTSIQVVVELCEHVPDFSEEVRHEIFRIWQEALANVRLHSGARCVTLSAQSDKDCLLIEVQDDGTGFESPLTSNPPPGHYGVVGMRERARRINGKVSVQSRPGGGTRVLLRVPLHANWNGRALLLLRSIAAAGKRYVGFQPKRGH